MNIETIPLNLINEPENAHRMDIEITDIMELGDSIKKHGLLNPITVRPMGGRYEIVAGHRRFLAHVSAGLESINAIVREFEDNKGVETIKAIENLHRADLTPVEEARYVFQMYHDDQMDIEAISKALSRSQDWVETRLLIAQLDDDLINALHTKTINIGHAQQLSMIDDKETQQYFLSLIERGGVTIPILRQWVSEYLQSKKDFPDIEPELPPMHEQGERPIITLPCMCCGDHHNHIDMQIGRVCGTCYDAAQHGPAALTDRLAQKLGYID